MTNPEIRLERRDYRHHLTEIRPMAEQLNAVVEQLERAGLRNGARQLKTALTALGIKLGDPTGRLLRLVGAEGRQLTLEVIGANEVVIEDIIERYERRYEMLSARFSGEDPVSRIWQTINKLMLDPPRFYKPMDTEFWQFYPYLIVWGDEARLRVNEGPDQEWRIVIDPDDPEEIQRVSETADREFAEAEEKLSALAMEFLQRVLKSKGVERQTADDPYRLGTLLRRHLKTLDTGVKVTTRSEGGNTLVAWVQR